MKKHTQLHRVALGSRSDWENVPESKRSYLQTIASRTYGIVTPGTAITLLGFYLVLTGLLMFVRDDQLLGAIYVFIGRWMDAFDGAVADATKTKSFAGATIDEGVDTLLLGAALVLLTSYNVLPVVAALLIVIPKSLNAASSLAAKARGKRLYPTGASKFGTAIIWMSIGAFMLYVLLAQVSYAPIRVDLAGWLLLVAGLVLTVPSTLYYMSVGFGSKQQDS